mmetsp:Transcript_7555/g.33342  ORF Transcript_7555/g.33342 Transcript_7555/m.33342 type:complete len:232 (-) Transcript_7555:312-1007(-)
MEAAGMVADALSDAAAPRLPPVRFPAAPPAPGVSFTPPVVTSVLILLSSLWLVYARHTPLDHMTHASSSPAATATALDAPSGTLTSNSHAVFTLRPLCSPPETLYMVTVRVCAFDRSAVTTTTPPPPLDSPQVSATLFAEPVFFFLLGVIPAALPGGRGGGELPGVRAEPARAAAHTHDDHAAVVVSFAHRDESRDPVGQLGGARVHCLVEGGDGIGVGPGHQRGIRLARR